DALAGATEIESAASSLITLRDAKPVPASWASREAAPTWADSRSTDAAAAAAAHASAMPSVAAPAGEAAQASGEPVLRDPRHESAVLFSLRDLAKIADSTPAARSPATIEGSGLLDIRSIARKLGPAAGERGAPEVPLFGPVSFGEPTAIVPLPPGRDRRLVW